jgi:hypothetical protein
VWGKFLRDEVNGEVGEYNGVSCIALLMFKLLRVGEVGENNGVSCIALLILLKVWVVLILLKVDVILLRVDVVSVCGVGVTTSRNCLAKFWFDFGFDLVDLLGRGFNLDNIIFYWR